MNLNKIIFAYLITACTSVLASEKQSIENRESVVNIIETAQVEIKDIDTLSHFDEAYLMECNSNHQALIYGRSKGEPYRWGFWDFEKGMLLFPEKSSDGWEDEWLRINRNGLVVGVHQRLGKSHNAFYYDIITFDLEEGYKTYKADFENKINMEKGDFIARCRNSEWIVINRKADNSKDNKILSLKDGKIMDLTPSLYGYTESFGLDVGGWIVSDVNSEGMFFGKFSHYEKHPFKDKKIEAGTHYFMKDAESFYLIDDLPSLGYWSAGSTPLWNGGAHSSFDDAGCFFYSGDLNVEAESMIWTPAKGLKKLTIPEEMERLIQQENIRRPKPVGHLDDGTNIWLISYNSWILEHPYRGYIFEKNGNCRFIPIDNEYMPLFNNLAQYPSMKLAGRYRPFFQTSFGFIQTNIFDENHPCFFQIK